MRKLDVGPGSAVPMGRPCNARAVCRARDVQSYAARSMNTVERSAGGAVRFGRSVGSWASGRACRHVHVRWSCALAREKGIRLSLGFRWGGRGLSRQQEQDERQSRRGSTPQVQEGLGPNAGLHEANAYFPTTRAGLGARARTTACARRRPHQWIQQPGHRVRRHTQRLRLGQRAAGGRVAALSGVRAGSRSCTSNRRLRAAAQLLGGGAAEAAVGRRTPGVTATAHNTRSRRSTHSGRSGGLHSSGQGLEKAELAQTGTTGRGGRRCR